MADLIVVTGPPGAGKSTVAAILAVQFDSSALVAGDDFFAKITNGYLAPWTVAAHDQNAVVIGAAAAAAGHLAGGGYTVVYDGVVGPWFRAAFAAQTGLPCIQYAVLMPPEATCLERVKCRSGHGFTDLDATRHMYREFAQSEPDSRHVVRATDGDSADSVAASITAKLRAGSLAWPAN